jgi:hypothetical protein
MAVEEEKDAQVRGFYIHPELYGAPEEKQIEWARHPAMMKRMKEQQAKTAVSLQNLVTRNVINQSPGGRQQRPLPYRRHVGARSFA